MHEKREAAIRCFCGETVIYTDALDSPDWGSEEARCSKCGKVMPPELLDWVCEYLGTLGPRWEFDVRFR